jgi:hypothetical protein
MTMSRLTDFYRGHGTDSEGRTLAQVWAFGDDELEDIHDFIQWLFPLREPSRFNPDAPLLTAAEIAEFRSDPELQANLLRSFEVFLAFLGLRYEEGRVVAAPDFERKAGAVREPNHNWLRITRVLTSARTLGLEAESRAFFEFLKSVRDGGGTAIAADTFGFWERAALGPSPGH